ncbi:N-acetylmuramoyl-L-alanine amidase [Thermosyntropha sp.]|uniref:N-acetylmuramoyl-L-alanine amidase n=1 Tax=Thermosyntropha sp. TaxID=2740820 RepID=UPI0025D57F7C|nr:N-acetylmuramoyl-L-alanine amidase [Thermosyntropha sp.]MBO8158814.1 N-acetylmuramoyl-L-alanine amidase [Thermosyntropha sp.]
MKIIETNLQFNGLRSRKSTRRVIVHHSASSDVPANEIHKWHKNRGWAGIGYHFVIRANGQIERGRPEFTIGAHAGKTGNPDSIGIVLTGNFEIEKPMEAQIDNLVWLIREYLYPKYGELEVVGHKDVMPTSCPGKKFPWAELRRRLEVGPMPEQWKVEIIERAKKAGLITSDHNPDELASKWFVLAVALNLLKVVGK